ncbi:MAG: AAA family ATPase [Spirochaetales bacterium]|nr:AAA family ATPase [Spirochaetales bacterium]
MNLFEASSKRQFEPLAARMRPRTLEEFVGQEHILGKGRLLRRAIQLDQLSSLIFYGPPGTGKTTLARVVANTTKSIFTTLNAVLAGVQEVRAVVAEAQKQRDYYDHRTILFVDEVHRWNKAQQDALLPWVENGTVIFIGATTENPFFKVNQALLSRSRVFQMQPLTGEDLLAVARQALADPERGYGKYKVAIDDGALAHLVKIADGDARSLLNALELAVETTPDTFPPPMDQAINITLDIAQESIQKKAVLYDREGDYHYDTISAFIKSLRGSDPDAASYWMARMVAAGEDPAFLFRRMLVFACEDVGLADPQALVFTEACAAAFERVGLPEGRYHLAAACLYLATAPKSNSAMAFFDALKVVEEEAQGDVPAHLKDGNRDKKGFGHGEGYLYPHAFRDHWVSQQYLPDALKGRVFFKPSEIGYERSIRTEVERRREIQLESLALAARPEVLSYSADAKSREAWLRRAQGSLYAEAADARERVFAALTISRHDRVLDLNAGRGLLLWEAVRRTPEGGVAGLVWEKTDLEILGHYAAERPESERPLLVPKTPASFTEADLPADWRGAAFEHVVGRNAWSGREAGAAIGGLLARLLQAGGRVSLAERIPRRSTRLSELVRDTWPEGAAVLEKIESLVYANPDNPLVDWDEADVEGALAGAGLAIAARELVPYTERRFIAPADVDRWLKADPKIDSYGKRLAEVLAAKESEGFAARLRESLAGREVEWRTVVLYIAGEK